MSGLGHRIISIAYIAIRMLLGIMWLWNAIIMSQHPYEILRMFYKVGYGSGVATYLSVSLPAIQLTLAVLLLSDFCTTGALLLSSILAGVYLWISWYSAGMASRSMPMESMISLVACILSLVAIMVYIINTRQYGKNTVLSVE